MITIKRVHIKNFRSIVDETIELTDFNCFVGKNDSGKSNVLKALNLFFNDETDCNVKFDFHNDYSKIAKRGAKQAKEITIELDIVVPTSFKENGIKTWRKTWRVEGLHSDNLETLFSANSRGNTLFKRIQYKYIPAVKSNEYFKSLLSDVYLSMTKTADSALRGLNKKYSEQLQSIIYELSEQIQHVLGIRSSLQMPPDLNTLFRDLSFQTSDKYVKGVDLNQRGDGIKARHIPLILRFMQSNMESSRPKKSIGGTYIWGFEEPENGVEYTSSFEMAQDFHSYVNDCQILITTHSPAFYMQGKNALSVCFLTQKDDTGASKYFVDNNQMYETMGLMQLVAPFIKKVRDEYIQQSSDVKNSLITQLSEAMEIMRRADQQLDTAQVLDVIGQYTDALNMLDDYDHQRIQKPQGNKDIYRLSYEECRQVIDGMRFSAESDIFGNEKDDSFKGSIGNIYQTFDGVDVYPSAEEKAANLLYFITKDHSFSDGNKRIAAAIFLYFLDKNEMLFKNGKKIIEDHTLVAIIVMIAESKPDEKETMISLIMNFLVR